MLAIPQEYLDATCEVKSMENETLTVARIIKIDFDALELAAPAGTRMPLLQYRMPVKLFAHSRKLEMRILVGAIYLSTENFLRAEEVRPLQNFERRGAFRVNTNVNAHLSPVLTEEEQAKLDLRLKDASPQEAIQISQEGRMDVCVMDISLTGLRLQSGTPLTVGSHFFVDFKLLDSIINLCLRVQRIVTAPNGDTHYGCIFFDFTEKQMDVLCKELFQLQRFEKKRRMNALGAL